MDDLKQNITNNLPKDSRDEMLKDSKEIDNEQIKEEDVHETLEETDPDILVDVNELATKLNVISEDAAIKEDHILIITERPKTDVFTVLSKESDGGQVEDEKQEKKEAGLCNVLGKTDPKSLKNIEEKTELALVKEAQGFFNTTLKTSTGILDIVLLKTELDNNDEYDFMDNATGFLD